MSRKNTKRNQRKAEETWEERAEKVTSLSGIAEMIESMQFKKRFGGVDETDVWNKIEVLDAMYRRALYREQERRRIRRKQTAADGRREES